MLGSIGRRWGLDWEVQLLNKGHKLPTLPYFQVGDALIIEVPVSEQQGEFKFITGIHMDSVEVLAKPIEVPMVAKFSRKQVNAPTTASVAQLVFVAQREGWCELFVDVSWERHEEDLAVQHCLCAPVSVNSVARIGPLRVEVQRHVPGRFGDGPQSMWWNGSRWSAKRSGRR